MKAIVETKKAVEGCVKATANASNCVTPKAELALKIAIESEWAVGAEDYVKAASGSVVVYANVSLRLLLRKKLQ